MGRLLAGKDERSAESAAAAPAAEDEKPKKPVLGGMSEANDEELANALAVWKLVLSGKADSRSFKAADHAGLGDPVKVETQVVAGVNYVLTFNDGSTAKVF